jgi:hypothetical protein
MGFISSSSHMKIQATKTSVAMLCFAMGLLLLPIALYYGTKTYTYEEALREFLQEGWGPVFWTKYILSRLPFVLFGVGGLLSVDKLFETARNNGIRSVISLKCAHLWLGAIVFLYVAVGLIVSIETMYF